MKIAALVLTLFLGAMLSAQASPKHGSQGLPCFAKVLKSEELPFAPMDYWLVRVALEITPPSDPAFVITRQDNMPIQERPRVKGKHSGCEATRLIQTTRISLNIRTQPF